jgi:hypothetical protein
MSMADLKCALIFRWVAIGFVQACMTVMKLCVNLVFENSFCGFESSWFEPFGLQLPLRDQTWEWEVSDQPQWFGGSWETIDSIPIAPLWIEDTSI